MYHPHLNPPPSETVSQFVIPAKPRARGASRDPEVSEIMPFHWIPDLAMYASLVRNDGFKVLRHSLQGGGKGSVVKEMPRAGARGSFTL
jgi:hypothetical protein